MKTKALAVALLGACLPLAGAQASELSVGGRIMPEACSIILPEGDLLNFGDLQVNGSGDAFSFGAAKSLPVSISCNGSTNVGLKFRDLMLDGGEPKDWFALVDEADELIGQVKMSFLPGTADGTAVTLSMRYPHQGYANYAITGDPENYMRIETPDPRGYQDIKIPMRVSLIGNDLEAKDIVNAAAIRSQVGIDLHYL
ncbi:hypothetical protein JY411_03650 [Stenotrophomonas maltophilia]|nr:hypothetical protein [Stenotrophomonas maltophilia]MBN4968165.1 hypothetical protein [Stenotrophomonas maltophilia]